MLFYAFDKWRERFNMFSQKKSLFEKVEDQYHIKKAIIATLIKIGIFNLLWLGMFHSLLSLKDIGGSILIMIGSLGISSLLWFMFYHPYTDKPYTKFKKLMTKIEVTDFIAYRDRLIHEMKDEKEIILLIKDLIYAANNDMVLKSDRDTLLSAIERIKRNWVDTSYSLVLDDIIICHQIALRYQGVENTKLYDFNQRHNLFTNEMSEEEIEISATLR